MSAPGELDAYDPALMARYGPWLTRLLHRWFRAEFEGLEHLPEGPFLGVGNHSGGVLIPDTLVWLGAYQALGRPMPLLALAHDAMFSAYPAPLARALAGLGALRADRALALTALRRGYAVQVYPGGDHDACRSFAKRDEIVFAGRKGYVELAREAGVPIVPVASSGAHEALVILWDGAPLARWLGVDRSLRLATFPISLSVPWGLWVGPLPGYLPLPTKIKLRVLPAIAPDGDADAIDAKVRASLQDAVRSMARARRFPVLG